MKGRRELDEGEICLSERRFGGLRLAIFVLSPAHIVNSKTK